MIPYFHLAEIPFWPVPIKVWGLLVALGIVIATLVGARVAKKIGLNAAGFVDLAAWSALGGIVGARVGYLVMYGGGSIFSMQALRIWEGGMSMLGGVLGGIVAALILSRSLKPIWGYVEVAAFVYPLGEAIGRLGCFAIHDHPGISADLPFAVQSISGPRLDLGLVLSVCFAGLFGVFLFLRRKWHPGRLLFFPALLVGWGVIRFATDFLRAWGSVDSDFRLWLFTPAQIASVLFVGIGVWLLVKRPIEYRI